MKKWRWTGTHEGGHSHFEKWILPDYRRLSFVLLLSLIGHGLAIGWIKLSFPSLPKSSQVDPHVTLQKSFPSDPFIRKGNETLNYHIHYHDPSAIAIPNIHYLQVPFPRIAEAKNMSVEMTLESITFVDERPDLKEITTANLAQNFLDRRIGFFDFGITNAFLPDEKEVTGQIVFSLELQERVPKDVPSLFVVETDQSLSPTVLRLGVVKDGSVAVALVENSSGNVNCDREALNLARKLRFRSEEKENIWGTVVFYWLQRPIKSESNLEP